MESKTVLFILVGIILFEYVFDHILSWMNYKQQNEDLPEDLKGIYKPEAYAKAMEYQKVNTKFGWSTGLFSLILILAVLWFGLLGKTYDYLLNFSSNEILAALLFFGVIGLVSDLLTLPFQIYKTFGIEERFGFNKSTTKLFIADKLKGYLLAALIGGLVVGVLLWLVQFFGSSFWWIFWIFMFGFSLFMNIFYTSLFLPLFNKLSPLEDGSLKDAINAFAKKVDFPIDNIYVIDGSKRSAKSNAFFSGIGKKKKVVFYDTLLENHSEDELVAILAHEVGHYKKKHIIQSLIATALQMGLMLWIMSLVIFNPSFSKALGAQSMAIALNLVVFSLLYAPISRISGILMNVVSRKNEFEADAYAAANFEAQPLIDALKNLSVKNLSNLFPHNWYVFFNYSHPPLMQRLNALKKVIA